MSLFKVLIGLSLSFFVMLPVWAAGADDFNAAGVKLRGDGSVDDKVQVPRGTRAEGAVRPERKERVERAEKVEKAEKAERPEKIEKLAKAERPEKIEKVERAEKAERPEKIEKRG